MSEVVHLIDNIVANATEIPTSQSDVDFILNLRSDYFNIRSSIACRLCEVSLAGDVYL